MTSRWERKERKICWEIYIFFPIIQIAWWKVVNCVPNAPDRGRMLQLLQQHLREEVQPTLLLSYPIVIIALTIHSSSHSRFWGSISLNPLLSRVVKHSSQILLYRLYMQGILYLMLPLSCIQHSAHLTRQVPALLDEYSSLYLLSLLMLAREVSEIIQRAVEEGCNSW